MERLQSLDPKHEKAKKKKKNRRKQKHGRVSRALKTKSDKKDWHIHRATGLDAASEEIPEEIRTPNSSLY